MGKKLIDIQDAQNKWLKKIARELGTTEKEFFQAIIDQTMRSGDLINQYKEKIKVQKMEDERKELETRLKESEESLKIQQREIEETRKRLASIDKKSLTGEGSSVKQVS